MFYESAARYLNRSERLQEHLLFFWMLAAIFLIWVVLVWLDRRRRVQLALAEVQPAAAGLFSELCNAHHLDAQEVQLARQVAEVTQTAVIERVFVHRHLFLEAEQALPDQATALQRLAQRLFQIGNASS